MWIKCKRKASNEQIEKDAELMDSTIMFDDLEDIDFRFDTKQIVAYNESEGDNWTCIWYGNQSFSINITLEKMDTYFDF